MTKGTEAKSNQEELHAAQGHLKWPLCEVAGEPGGKHVRMVNTWTGSARRCHQSLWVSAGESVVESAAAEPQAVMPAHVVDASPTAIVQSTLIPSQMKTPFWRPPSTLNRDIQLKKDSARLRPSIIQWSALLPYPGACKSIAWVQIRRTSRNSYALAVPQSYAQANIQFFSALHIRRPS